MLCAVPLPPARRPMAAPLLICFRRPWTCRETILPNIEYLFYSSTTWATGRNLLLEAAKYLYRSTTFSSTMRLFIIQQQNHRTSENFLKRIERAVETFPQHPCHPASPSCVQSWKVNGCGILYETAECLPVVIKHTIITKQYIPHHAWTGFMLTVQLDVKLGEPVDSTWKSKVNYVVYVHNHRSPYWIVH